ncbi:hypothetical protein NEOLI_005203 [Neolecta irregularis DAH-3]|uniref:Uncharacterized protein n=1 Tax=Neolecta irregularis (strain DAH-3) TaxID=1198029 RepID=A0A1U7LI45_NEOID|nr:hypothetical protein NEOLI_005203 [Neolecta irregularis DAH-3]|eukprot:OLL22330.1 hypothetical protein NEOLI_005203 [Neolecta irregularis DAH-3]
MVTPFPLSLDLDYFSEFTGSIAVGLSEHRRLDEYPSENSVETSLESELYSIFSPSIATDTGALEETLLTQHRRLHDYPNEVEIASDSGLRHAELRHAELRRAELRRAEFRHAELRLAELRHAEVSAIWTTHAVQLHSLNTPPIIQENMKARQGKICLMTHSNTRCELSTKPSTDGPESNQQNQNNERQNSPNTKNSEDSPIVIEDDNSSDEGGRMVPRYTPRRLPTVGRRSASRKYAPYDTPNRRSGYTFIDNTPSKSAIRKWNFHGSVIGAPIVTWGRE